MAEGAQVEVRAQLAVDARELVEVEGRGHAQRVVVGRFQHAARLPQVSAQEQGVSGREHAAQGAQEGARLFGVEVADVRAEKERERARSCGLSASALRPS